MQNAGIAFKKTYCLLLSVAFLISVFAFNATTTYASSSYFTEAELEELYDLGYPESESSNIDSFYEDYIDVLGGSVLWYGDFYRFVEAVGTLDSTSEGENLSNEYHKILRAIYFEVSNMTNRVDDVDAIADSLTNRVTNQPLSTWNTYYSAASINGLDGLNPTKPVTYWHGIMLDPIADAAWSPDARLALIEAYIVTYDMMTSEFNFPGQYSTWPRHSNLKTKMYYFNESSGDQKVGDFWFREVF